MRVFVCEFVTGGGLRGETLPPSLAREGAMMRDALVRDLADCPGVRVSTSHDDRLAAPERAESAAVAAGDDPWSVWERLAGEAEIAWVVAPETGGALARLDALARSRAPQVVGPDEEAIAIASSKIRTAERLASAGVRTPATWRPGEVPAGEAGPFVVKPDDGAGCEATRLVARPPAARDLPPGFVVQPFVPGQAASLTVLRSGGETRLLSANRQFVTIKDGAFRFRGVRVAALDDSQGELAALAQAVGRALPGLSGVFGIDLVLGADDPVVIEVNPRLTTAYAGLREAIGINPARLLPPFASPGPVPAFARRAVEIAL